MSNAHEHGNVSSSNDAAEAAAALTHLDIAPGIIESIVAIAVEEIPGIASVGTLNVDMGKDTVLTEYNHPDGVELIADDGQIELDLRIQVFEGCQLAKLASEVKQVVSEALQSHAGIKAKAINIEISGIEIKKG